MARLPTPGADSGAWGDILNDFLSQSHNTDGTLKPASITGSNIADNAVSEAKLDPAVQVKLNGAGGTTDLGHSTTNNSVTVTSSSGSSTILPSATTIAAGVLTASDKTKLDGVAAGATVNSSDATLLNRANHTGTQAISTITGLQGALDGKEAVGTVATHEGASDPHPQYLTESSASTTYAVALAGVPTGGTAGQVLTKDSATNYDVSWQTIAGGGAVDSVNGQTGAVVLDIDDVVPAQTDQGGKVIGTDGVNATWTTLPATPPSVATSVYNDVNALRPVGADIVFWIPDSPLLGDPVNAALDDVLLRTEAVELLMFALSDETTALTIGGAKLTARAPFACTVVNVRASLSTASSSGVVTVNIKEAGASIFSTLLTIDPGQKTSLTATAPAVISDSAVANDAELTFDIDTAGTGATGLKVSLYVVRT